ncbi:MAG: prepilin peptidase [Verrucomicrobiota bacterium]|nr:prepilin peptidase [Chthoniobacterales bacterium]MDQ3115060.1 prepilin peptidase [Verrucomicrobiota bacterium]
MEALPAYELLFRVFAFVLGAAVGSFLNVCIYRLPRDLSVNQPRRSFCPSCKNPIPWHQNVPLLSWLALRGKCASCGNQIAFRYFAVELLTALLFLAVWLVFPWQIALVYWVFVSLLTAASFIDFEHFIIPDEITIGGTVAGVLASLALPALMGEVSRLRAFGWSLGGAALGYGLLWVVLEGGKLAFGKRKIRLDAPTPFSWVRQNDDAEFVVGEERELWSDHFARESDRLLLHCDQAEVDGRPFANTILQFHYNRLAIGEETFQLDAVDRIAGIVRELQIPREAMGRGDLKFLAAIGAFLGWQAVLCAIFAGSLLGSLVGLTSMILGKREWSGKIPFGPYLALGALIWMFFGDDLLGWYVGLLSR